MEQHTALPWQYWYKSVFSEAQPICQGENDDDLRYIVKACNSFPQLVFALKEITDRFERLEKLYFEATQQAPDGENGSVVRARAALKEAKEA